MHFGTNGSLQLVGRGQSGPPYTRLALNFDDGDVLAYINPRRLGGVGLRDSMRALIAELALGPDVADPAFDLGAFIAILGASKRDIKAVLMDQRLMAGLGNIYSDEVLFQARIHPDTAASSLRAADAARLFTAMRETLRRAVERGAGSETGLDRLPADFLLPRRRRGGRCPRCGTTLATAKHGGRTSYYCPRCQPK